MFFCLAIFTLLGCVCLSSGFLENGDDRYALPIRMPNVSADRADALICTAQQLDPEETYIGYVTRQSHRITHHMTRSVEMIPDKSSLLGHLTLLKSLCQKVCAAHSAHMENTLLDLPLVNTAVVNENVIVVISTGVGLRVSGSTDINYLVVQIHYAKPFSPGVTDNSGYTIELTHKRPPQQAGYLVLGNWGIIPPHQTDFHMDSACEFPLTNVIYPFAYRTHSHNLGVVTSGYRIRDGEWTEIGRMSPQLPQAFYDVSHPGMDIRPGDVLASRCIMNSMSRDTETMIGHTNHDEMCNFYIMYSTYEQGNLENIMCFQDAKSETFLDGFPPTSGSLEGIPGAEEVKKKFRMV